VAVLEKRGRVLAATPFFARGGGHVSVDRDKRGQARPGDLVLVAPVGRGGGHGRIVRRLGRPDVARDVLEPSCSTAGCAAGSTRPSSARRARPPRCRRSGRPWSAATCATSPRSPIDPPTARDFDDAISAEGRGDERVRVWVHIADVAAHVRPGSLVDREAHRRATSVYVPGRGRADAARGALQRRLLTRPGPGPSRRHRRARLRGRRRRRTAFHRSLIRSDARLDYPRSTASSRARSRRGAVGGAAGGGAGGVGRARGAARAQGALAVESAEPEFRFSREGHVTELGPDVQTESHRLIEHG
jgi:ribonuclease R